MKILQKYGFCKSYHWYSFVSSLSQRYFNIFSFAIMLQKAIFVIDMKSKFYHNSSKIGIVLSFICAIHCILMPIIMMSFPFLNNSFLHDPILEWLILGSLIFLGVFSLDHYKKKHHGSNSPMIIFGIGSTLCFFSLIIHSEFHQSLMIIGSILIAVSQAMNLTLKRVIQ